MKALIRVVLLVAIVACMSKDLPSAPRSHPTQLRVKTDSLVVSVEEGDIYDLINAYIAGAGEDTVRDARLRRLIAEEAKRQGW